jgi:hypothetical protein
MAEAVLNSKSDVDWLFLGKEKGDLLIQVTA